jgi:hypothetical protein
MSEVRNARSWEFAAIPIVVVVLGILAIIMWAADAGVAAWLGVGAVGLAAVIVASVVSMRRPRHPVTAPPLPPRVEDGIHRVLVIADEACDPGALGATFAGNGRSAALVVAPALGSRTARWTNDEHAYREAQEHLDATVRALSELGVDARGHIGSHDPLQAADDGLREFPADEIVFAVHDAGSVNWLEDGVVAAARSRYSIPVKAVERTATSA